MVRSSPDLPAPWSPVSAVTWPAGMSRSTLVRAWTAPKCLSTPRILSSGSSPTGWVAMDPRCVLIVVTPPRGSAAASNVSRLSRLRLRRDAGSGADARTDRGAERRGRDEVVLDDRRRHVRRGDPHRGQQRSGLLTAGDATRRLGGAVEQGGRR